MTTKQPARDGGIQPGASSPDEVFQRAADAMRDPPEQQIRDLRRAAARQQAARETLERLRAMGSGISFPTNLRPHLVCAKARKGDKLHAEHGVTFRRDGGDCLVEAGNQIAFVSLLLEGEGEEAPHLAIVPREAMEIIAGADDEMATLWFRDCKVWVLVDQAVHEFFVLQPDLPMGGESLRATDLRQKNLRGPQLNAAELAKIQKALACESMAMRWHSRAVVSLYPDGVEQSPHRGFLALWGSTEDSES